MTTDQIADRVARVLVEDMFQVSAGETVAITVDDGSHMDVVKAIFSATKNSCGLPKIIEIPVGRGDSEVGMPDWPASPLTATLCNVDIWIEMNSVVLLYSTI